jgi:hypothetical protein
MAVYPLGMAAVSGLQRHCILEGEYPLGGRGELVGEGGGLVGLGARGRGRNCFEREEGILKEGSAKGVG